MIMKILYITRYEMGFESHFCPQNSYVLIKIMLRECIRIENIDCWNRRSNHIHTFWELGCSSLLVGWYRHAWLFCRLFVSILQPSSHRSHSSITNFTTVNLHNLLKDICVLIRNERVRVCDLEEKIAILRKHLGSRVAQSPALQRCKVQCHSIYFSQDYTHLFLFFRFWHSAISNEFKSFWWETNWTCTTDPACQLKSIC